MSNNTTIFLYVQDMYPIYKVWLLSSNLLMLAFLSAIDLSLWEFDCQSAIYLCYHFCPVPNRFNWNLAVNWLQKFHWLTVSVPTISVAKTPSYLGRCKPSKVAGRRPAIQRVYYNMFPLFYVKLFTKKHSVASRTEDIM